MPIEFRVAPEVSVANNASPTDELGQSGLMQFRGLIEEAYLRELRYPQAYDKFNEMRRRDPTIASLLNAVKLLARTATWSVERAGSSEADKRAAEFLEQNMSDMSVTFQDVTEDLLSAIPFGWAWSEIVYKRRDGTTAEPASKYDDGALGWRKFAPRRQSSFVRWEFDENDGVQGLWQSTRATGKPRFLPIDKSIHFVADRDMGNPEGMSILEPMYESWHYVKNLQIIMGIGFERSFVGLPVFEYADGYEPSDADKTLVASTGKGLRVDEKAFVGVPANIKFHLETTTNTNAAALLETIKQYRIWCLMVVMADFIALGTMASGGSYSLGQDKSELFLMAVDGWLDKIAHPDNLGVLNRYAVPRLFAYNSGFEGMTDYPRIKHSTIQKPTLPALANYLSTLSGFITPDPELEVELRRMANLPQRAAGAAMETADDNIETGDKASDVALSRTPRRRHGLGARGVKFFEMQFEKALAEFNASASAALSTDKRTTET